MGELLKEGSLTCAHAFAVRTGQSAALPFTIAYEAARCAGYVLGLGHRRLPAALCRRLSNYPGRFG